MRVHLCGYAMQLHANRQGIPGRCLARDSADCPLFLPAKKRGIGGEVGREVEFPGNPLGDGTT